MGRCLRVHRFWEEHAAQLGLSWHCALVIGFSLPSLLGAIVFTGDSDTPQKCIKRYASTGKHLAMWHTGNIFDPADPAFTSLQTVRHMHSGVRDSMNQKLPPQQHKWISQYDMACVQLGFLGPISLFGDKIGCRASAQAMEDYSYFWRCVGYQLGIGDEFNPCSLGGAYTKTIIRQMIDQVLLPDIANPPAQYSHIADAYIGGVNLAFLGIPVMSVASTMAFTYWGLEVKGPSLSFADKCRYLLLRLIAVMMWAMPPYRRSLGRSLVATLRWYDGRDEREAAATCTSLALCMLVPPLLLLVAVLVAGLSVAGAAGALRHARRRSKPGLSPRSGATGPGPADSSSSRPGMPSTLKFPG